MGFDAQVKDPVVIRRLATRPRRASSRARRTCRRAGAMPMGPWPWTESCLFARLLPHRRRHRSALDPDRARRCTDAGSRYDHCEAPW